MGIPSYFRKLVGQYKGLIRRDKPGVVGWLMFDFNCLVYHVLARPDCPVYSADRHEEWEAEFLNEIARYTLKVIRAVDPVVGVYIAIDGVAPMAKIKQQRMRRFKPAAGSEGAAVAAEPRTSWDKNALTPGTRFMDKLSARLQQLVREHQPAGQRWILSDTSEPGEGEQKIVARIREGLCGERSGTGIGERSGTGIGERSGTPGSNDSVVVYGLDADLIVLSMWTRTEVFPERPMWLFRERVERGEMIRDATGEEMFEWFSVAVLEDAISTEGGVAGAAPDDRRAWVQDYCAAMMLLGNDFLPTSMTFRLKENGHGRLLDMLGRVRRGGKRRLWMREGGLDLGAWTAAIQYLSNAEEDRFLRAVQKKLGARGDDTDPEDEPLRVRADAIFLDADAGAEQPQQLRRDWRRVYADLGFGGNTRGAVDMYIQGMQWVVDYYTGNPVNMEWVYPWHFAPLWEQVYMGLATGGWRAVPAPNTRVLRPVEQLAMVLPLRSWSLIRADESVAKLPALAPHWFPEGFALNSVGKRYAWECEPEIPIPLPAQVWALVERE